MMNGHNVAIPNMFFLYFYNDGMCVTLHLFVQSFVAWNGFLTISTCVVSHFYVLPCPCVSWNGLFTWKLCHKKNKSMVLCLYVLACVAWNNLFSCKLGDNYCRCVVSHLCVPICVALNGLLHCKCCDNDHMVLISNKGSISGLLFH